MSFANFVHAVRAPGELNLSSHVCGILFQQSRSVATSWFPEAHPEMHPEIVSMCSSYAHFIGTVRWGLDYSDGKSFWFSLSGNDQRSSSGSWLISMTELYSWFSPLTYFPYPTDVYNMGGQEVRLRTLVYLNTHKHK